MTKIPPPTQRLAELIDAAMEARAEPPRPHMGCSLLGSTCDRYLWLSFRWALTKKTPGRVLRMFRRGNNEEAVARGDLEAAGIVMRPTVDGKQARVDFGSHVSGSLDDIAESGVPEAPTKPHVIDYKTHNKKNFDAFVADGVAVSHKRHYTQIQTYMHGTGIDRALYVAICKDDDRIHTERVRYVRDHAEKAIARGKRLALADEQPPPLSTDPSWYECKMCDGYDWCHKGVGLVEKNCRICAHSTAMPDGTWRCEKHNADDIPVDFQRTGCADYEIHDHLLPF